MTEALPVSRVSQVAIRKPEVVKSAAVNDIDLSKAIIVDAHLLKTFRACQMKYYWFEEEHLIATGKSAAPGFGISIHSAAESFRKSRQAGIGFTESLNKAKMDLQIAYSKNMPAESQLEVKQDEKRSLPNALRIFEGYCKHYEPFCYKYIYVEIPFAMYIGQIDDPSSGDRKDVIYVGIIDGVLEWRGRLYVNDLKTTAWTLNESWLEGFRMDQGLIGYTLAAQALLGVDTQYALVHGIWVQKEPKTDKAKKLDEYFKSRELYWTPEQLGEWHKNTLRTVQAIEDCRFKGEWVMDYGQNCGAFGGCAYRGLCSSPPGFRKQFISNFYEEAFWTPLEDERLQKVSALEL